MAENATTEQLIRAARYRAEGWWRGERLEARFLAHVTADPYRTCVTDDAGRTLTRRGLWDAAVAFADELTARGVGAGDRVLIYLPNRTDWQVALLAALQLRAIPATVPVSTDLATLTYISGQVGASAIVTVGEHRRRPTGEFAHEAAATAPQPVAVAVVDEAGVRTWTEHSGRESAAPVPAEVEQLMFTSSTTGLPKAVMHTVDTLAAVNAAFAERYGLTEDTPIFMPSPLGHSVGAWHGGRLSLYTGAHLVLQDLWDPEAALAAIDRHECFFTAAATPFLKDVIDVPWTPGTVKLASLRAFLCGGAPVPASLVEEAAVQAPNTFVTVLWGMTEGGVTTCPPGTPRAVVAHSAGCPLPGLELTILPADGVSGDIGELAMRGPGVFVGYLGQSDLYRQHLTADGFFRTGDLAMLDSDGFVHLDGRIKDLIIRGGINISPTPIEDAISAHPGVRRVAVIGAPDDRLGERICAVIVAKGSGPTLEQLQEWLTARGLSRRQLPESLVVVDDMPVTAAGKIRKVDLRRDLEGRL